MNVVQKFSQWFKRLTIEEQRDLYDILCMVRGPDEPTEGSHTAKMEITAKIRYVLGLWDNKRELEQTRDVMLKHNFYPVINENPFLPFHEMKSSADFGCQHYSMHALEAIIRLQELGFINDAEES